MNGQDRVNRYHGLINQGSTCYLNSVLQVLFRTDDFREAVTRYSEENLLTEFLDHHLKVLFKNLQNYTGYTYKITQKLGIRNVNEQRDAAEYFERILRMTSPDASKIFHGQLRNKTTCCKGHIQTDRDAPFWHLPLSLVDSYSKDYSVVKGIEEFFKPSDFCGENRMYCEKCDDKVDAAMTDVIKHHPDVLCLLLKRFEFNYNNMSYVKISCSVEVPYTLQIPETQTYELYAFVDHFGHLRGGHYTATIKIQEEHGDRWYTFYDTRVTELDYQPFQLDNTERSQTAYLLFYRKKKDTGIRESTINNEFDQSQDGKNKRKRRREREGTHIEDNPKAPHFREADGSPDSPCKIDTLEKEPNKGNGSGFIALIALDQAEDKVQKAKDKKPEKKSHVDYLPDTMVENMFEHRENKEKNEKYYSRSPNHAEKEDEKKTRTDFQHDTKGKISADKSTAEMCCDTFQDKDKVDEGKENILQDNQSHKHGKGQRDTLNMQDISVTHSNDNDVCVETKNRDMNDARKERKGNNNGDYSKFGQNTVGEVSGAAKTQKDVEEEMKVKEYEGNSKQIQTREKSHLRPAEAEIIEAPRKKQDAGTNEKTKAGRFQLQARVEIEGIKEGRCESFGTKMKKTRKETVEKTLEGRSKRRVKNNEGNTKNEIKQGVTQSKSEQKKRRAKREEQIPLDTKYTKIPKWNDVEIEAAESSADSETCGCFCFVTLITNKIK